MTSSDLYCPSWDTVDAGVSIVLSQIKQERVQPTVIVGLSRGGLIPAVILSHKLNIPMIPVSYSSKRGAGDNRDHNNVLPHIEDECILVVDDIADSGLTLYEFADYYQRKGKVVLTACLYYKKSARVNPSFYSYSIESNAPFIVFPWENDC